MAEKEQFLTYKGKPLVRNGNTIYYGNMNDSAVLLFQIITTKKVKDLDVADKVSVQLVSTDTSLKPQDRLLKRAEKRGLFNAIDIGTTWLERELSKTE